MTAEATSGGVRTERHGDCALLILDRPERLNALNDLMLDRLRTQVEDVAKSDARALLVTGAGERAFCAGADLGEVRGRSLEEHHASLLRGRDVLGKIADLAMPTLALVRGVALGGGLELALACDFRICSPDARFGAPEVKVGLLPGFGGTQRLPRLVGQAAALELILTGEPVDASRALSTGLVNAVVDGDLLEAGLAFARQITRHSLVTVRLAKAAVRVASEATLAEGLRTEAELSTVAYASDDAREGMAAFADRREPDFQDR